MTSEIIDTPSTGPSTPDITAANRVETQPGVFTIATQDEAEMESTRSGASRTDWNMADDGPGEDDLADIELPLVVWLRGDESWYPDFDLDADAVMQRLGIKRSRLTQISGRELRVGRVRIDRYIRPLYRSKDVAAYLEWTRATASHQRSSSAIKEAVQALQHQGSQISQVVESANQSFKEAIQEGLAEKVRHVAQESFMQLSERLSEFEQTTTTVLQDFHRNFLNLQNNLRSWLDRQASVQTTQWNAIEIHLESIENAQTLSSLRLAETSERAEKLGFAQKQVEEALLTQHKEIQEMHRMLTANPRPAPFKPARKRRSSSFTRLNDISCPTTERPFMARRAKARASR